MTRLFSALASASVGRLLWLNIAVLVALKFIVPLGGAGVATITGQIAGFDLDRVVFDTNRERSEAGVPKLLRNADLDEAASLKLDDMVAEDYFAHFSPSGTTPWDFVLRAGYRYQAAGENLARGFADPSAMVVAWMNSESHRANMLSPGFSDVGIAGRRADVAGRDAYVVVLMFARPYGTAAAPAVSVPPSTPQPQIAAAVTQSPIPPEPEVISTDSGTKPVAAPVRVSVRTATVPQQAAERVADWFSLYLIAVLGLLMAAAGWVGIRKHLVIGWFAHAAVFLVLIGVPAIRHTVSGIIL